MKIYWHLILVAARQRFWLKNAKRMHRAIFSSFLFLGLVFSAWPGSAAPLTKEQFLSQAGSIDLPTATAMSENLTNADWYEVDSTLLLDAFYSTLEARKKFAWDRNLPEDIYLKYVVPLRIESEPLQNFRRKFLEEIGPLLTPVDSLAQAALEVNLYLGVRVKFKSSDPTDQGPLTTLSSGFGRCEEMTILAIDALRSVGIPARPVWVPAFSDTDNNHVWVEVFTEDGWKYMGGAEPKTRLNEAWFDKKVPRAGIVLTMGRDYDGDDSNAVKSGSGYVLNVTPNYIPPAKLTVEMPENWGEGDHVWLAVFNFGTLRPLVKLIPRDGIATMEIGNGDFVLLGLHDGALFFQTFTARLDHETHVQLDLSRRAPQDFILTYPWPPLKEHKSEPELISKDRISSAYAEQAARTEKRNLPVDWLDRFIKEGGDFNDGQALFETLKRSPGNETTILNAVFKLAPEKRGNAIFIVSHLSDKHLREVKPEVLSRWFRRTAGLYDNNEELKVFVLNPQVGYEYSGTGLPPDYITGPVKFTSMDGLREEVARYSPLVDPGLHERLLPPVTIDHMLSDGVPVSKRNAALWWTDRLRRSGVPAKHDHFKEWLEFFYQGKWLPMLPDQPDKLGNRKANPAVTAYYEEPATVTLQWQEGALPPEWKTDFIFLPIRDDGMPDYLQDRPKDIMKKGNSIVVKLNPGIYMFSAGRRNGRGDVAAQVRVVNLEANEHRVMTIDLVPPPEPGMIKEPASKSE